MTVHLSTEDLLTLVSDLGVGPVRDLGLLDAAAHRPRARVLGRDAYPSLDEQAAALLESLVRGRPLERGNRRLGWVSVVVFYGLNDHHVEVSDDEAYELVHTVAEGRASYQDAAQLLARWR